MGSSGSSMRVDKKPGSSAGAGAGLGVGAGLGAGAGADASAAGADAAGSAATAVSAGVLAAASGAEAGAAGAAGVVGVAGTAGVCTATPAGALAAPAAAGAALLPAAADAALSLFRSVMFLDNSAIRVAASLACLSLATCSSAAFWPLTEPLDRVSLSGAAVAGFLSSTRVWTLPEAERWAAATSVEGAAPASLRRKSLKSRAWAARICRASGAGVDCAAAWSGICSTAPALRRLTLPWMNASGLARIMATSIWSSDTPAGLYALARRPAVSPACTVTPSAGAGRGGAARGAAGAAAGSLARAVAAGRVAGTWGAAGAEIWGAAVTAGAARRMLGGSNSMV